MIIKIILLPILLSLSWFCQAQELSSSVDRDTITTEETLQLIVRYNGNQTNASPDFSQLTLNFEIKNTGQSNQFKNINGRVTSFTEWTLILFPRKQGKLLIPSFTYGGSISDAIEITALPPTKAPTGSVKDVFVETILNKNTVYVQEQILLTYRLYYSKNVTSLNAEPLQLDNVINETLPDSNYSRIIDGKSYRIVEFHYALFPQTSGQLTIPPLTWDLKIASTKRSNSFFGATGRYEINRQVTDKKSIEVLPQPAEFPNNVPWLPASALTLEEKWNKDPSNFKVGEPITRTITLKAKGLMSSQLPQMARESANDAIKIYNDQAKLDDQKLDTGFNSSRIESAAIVVSENGRTVLPAIRVTWWDEETKQVQVAEIPERTVIAKGAPTAANTLTSQNSGANAAETDTNSNLDSEYIDAIKAEISLWRWSSLALLAACVLLSFFWWRSVAALAHQRAQTDGEDNNSTPANEKHTFALLKKLCLKRVKQDGAVLDTAELRKALIQWSATHWPDAKVLTLDDVHRLIDDDELGRLIQSIDEALYSPRNDTPFNGKHFFERLSAWIRSNERILRDASTLKPLYANS
ncbi:MAG: hypothetical protein ACI9Y1_002136 [Lentisphaeria bacterium]|jgi:hypothetical protein